MNDLPESTYDGLMDAIYNIAEKSKDAFYTCKKIKLANSERPMIDFLTKSSRGTYKCYEIKLSISDFNIETNIRKKKILYGDFYYYVMSEELYKQTKNFIPSTVGVYIYNRCVKYPKRRKPSLKEKTMLDDSMIRYLYLENKRFERERHKLEILVRDNKILKGMEKKMERLKVLCIQKDPKYFEKVIKHL